MGLKRCSGATAFSTPTIEVLPCPDCGTDVEVWSDEATGQCPTCSRTVIRSVTQSCVDWCRYAKECLGDEKYEQYGEMKAAMRKSALIKAVEDRAGSDVERVAYAREVLAYAEMLLSEQREADPTVVMAAAALYGPTRGAHEDGLQPESEADPERMDVAMDILNELGYPQGLMKEVRELLSPPGESPRRDSLHFKLLHDAVLLAGSHPAGSAAKRRAPSPEFLDSLLTEAGRNAARRR